MGDVVPCISVDPRNKNLPSEPMTHDQEKQLRPWHGCNPAGSKRHTWLSDTNLSAATCGQCSKFQRGVRCESITWYPARWAKQGVSLMN